MPIRGHWPGPADNTQGKRGACLSEEVHPRPLDPPDVSQGQHLSSRVGEGAAPPRRPLRRPRTPALPHRAVSAALPCPERGPGDSSSPAVQGPGAGPITPSGRWPARLGDPLESRPSPQTLEPRGARMPHRPRHQMHPKQTQTPDLLHRPTHLTPHTHLTPLPRPPRFWGNQGV